MGTNPSTPTVQIDAAASTDPITTRPAISADEAIRTLRRLRAAADADAVVAPARPVSLDAETFRRFVSTVRLTRPVPRRATHPVASMSTAPDAVMAHRMNSFC